MGFGRNYADASVTFPYICSLDTALPAAPYPECPEAPAPGPEAAPEGDQKDAKAAALAEYLAEFYTTPAGASLTAEERQFLAELTEPAALTVFCQRRTKRQNHKDYQRTGSEALLGTLGPDVIRFKLHALEAPDRATALGFARDTSDGLTDYARKYKVGRFVLERTLVGAENWPEFKADKGTKHVAPSVFAVFPEDWVIEIGFFLLDLPNLTEREKKA